VIAVNRDGDCWMSMGNGGKAKRLRGDTRQSKAARQILSYQWRRRSSPLHSRAQADAACLPRRLGAMSNLKGRGV
jgi:hypothetical protein